MCPPVSAQAILASKESVVALSFSLDTTLRCHSVCATRFLSCGRPQSVLLAAYMSEVVTSGLHTAGSECDSTSIMEHASKRYWVASSLGVSPELCIKEAPCLMIITSTHSISNLDTKASSHFQHSVLCTVSLTPSNKIDISSLISQDE